MSYNWSIEALENGIVMEHTFPSKVKKKTPLLFVHGNFCGSWCFHNLLRYFASRGVSSYAVNLRGHWLSQGHFELGKATVEDYVEDVEACIKKIDQEVILIGHSMGGIVCQKVAERNAIEKLILLDSAPCKEITETVFQPKPGTHQVLKELFKDQPDGTVIMKRDEKKIEMLLFEKNKVSKETLAQTVAYIGRESGHVIKNHPLVSVSPNKVTCPCYVLARTGLGNEENPHLWDALADYYSAVDRQISEDISHTMFMEEDWEKHAACIEKWCFG